MIDISRLKENPAIKACFSLEKKMIIDREQCSQPQPATFLLIIENSGSFQEIANFIQNNVKSENLFHFFSLFRKLGADIFIYAGNPPLLEQNIILINQNGLDSFDCAGFGSFKEDFSTDTSYALILQQKMKLLDDDSEIVKKIESLYREAAIKFEKASRLYFYGRPYGFYRNFISAVDNAINLFSILRNKDKDPAFREKLLGNIENEFERKFLEGLFPQPTELYVNLYKRKFLDFMEWLSEEFIEMNPDLERIFNPILEFMKSIYERDYFWNNRLIEGTKTLFRGPDPRIYNEDERILKLFKTKKITATIDLRGDYEAGKAADFRNYLEKKGIHAYVVNFNEIPNSNENLYGYVKKLIHRADELVKALRIIIQNSGNTYIHCHSGKDRTGVFSALIMKLFGKSNEEIIREYCRTGLDARKERILTVINYLDENYPIIDDYFKEIGLSDEEIAALKQK